MGSIKPQRDIEILPNAKLLRITADVFEQDKYQGRVTILVSQDWTTERQRRRAIAKALASAMVQQIFAQGNEKERR